MLAIDMNTLLTICSVIISVSSAAAIIGKQFTKAIDKTTNKIKNETKKEIKEELLDPTVLTLRKNYIQSVDEINTQITKILSRMDNIDDSSEESKEISRNFRICTLKGLIVQAHGTYMQLGAISMHVLATLEDIFENYTALGGNHFVGDLMEDLRKLPRKED